MERDIKIIYGKTIKKGNTFINCKIALKVPEGMSVQNAFEGVKKEVNKQLSEGKKKDAK